MADKGLTVPSMRKHEESGAALLPDAGIAEVGWRGEASAGTALASGGVGAAPGAA